MSQAIIVVDLGFGDAGKGSLVDWLTHYHQAKTIVRFNGGAQAAHNVITPDGRHHTFSQFGSGLFHPQTRSYLSRYMLLDPYAMFNEADHLEEIGVYDPLRRTFLDRYALVISPYQQMANRLKETARGQNRHGSCGMGIGETVADSLAHPEMVIYAGDLSDSKILRQKLTWLRDYKLSQVESLGLDLSLFQESEVIDIAIENYTYLAEQINLVDETFLEELLKSPESLIFEGAQGVLLDETYGFAPHVTWSNTTFGNALSLLQSYEGQITRLGVLRSYFTRHGAGVFPTENLRLRATVPELHNDYSEWQQDFRVGHFDTVLARYALAVVGGIEGLALTHLDRLPSQKICVSYEHFSDDFFNPDGRNIQVEKSPVWERQLQLTQALAQCQPIYHQSDDFLAELEQQLNIPICITSHGLTRSEKSYRI